MKCQHPNNMRDPNDSSICEAVATHTTNHSLAGVRLLCTRHASGWDRSMRHYGQEPTGVTRIPLTQLSASDTSEP